MVPASTIAFVGSDSRDLYKTNIFRALALPKGYVWQYRYRRSLIHGDLIIDLKALKGTRAILFFATGNDLTIDENKRKLTYHPIRYVIVRDVIDDPVIGTVHFFLEMDDYADVVPHPDTSADKLSPKCLVTRVTTQDLPGQNWTDRVRGLAAHFPNQLFFYVRAVKKGGKTVQPEYSEHDRAARYTLTEETEYQVEISFYDPKGGNTGLSAENSSPDAALDVPSTHHLGTGVDTTTFPLQTHTLSRKQLLAHTLLKERERPNPSAVTPQASQTAATATTPASSPAPPTFDVQLQWYVTRGSHKPWLFGSLAIMAAVGVALAKLATDDLSKTALTWVNVCLALGAATCVGVPAGLLYWLFHKK